MGEHILLVVRGAMRDHRAPVEHRARCTVRGNKEPLVLTLAGKRSICMALSPEAAQEIKSEVRRRTEKTGSRQGGSWGKAVKSGIYLKVHPHPLPRSDVVVRAREACGRTGVSV